MNDEREAFAAALGAVLAPQSLRVLHKSIVVDQDADGNLGVKLTDSGAPSDTAKPVPLWLGLPCFFAKVKPNIEVSIGFHNGAENGAFAALFPTYPQGAPPVLPEDAPLPTLPIEYLSFGGGNKPIARVDDSVSNGALVFRQTPVGPAGVPSVLAIFYKNSQGVEIPVLTFPIPGPAVMLALDPEAPDPTTAIVPIGGKITSGRTEFRA